MSDHVREKISEYLDRQLSASEMEQVRIHLEGCANCRAVRDQYQATAAQMKASPLLTPPESFYSGVLARIDSKPKNSWWGWPAKLAASACVVLLAVLVARDGKDRIRQQETSISTADSDIRYKEEARPAPASVSSNLGRRDEPTVGLKDRTVAPLSVPAPSQNEVFQGVDEERPANKDQAELDKLIRKVSKVDPGSYELAQSVPDDVGVSQGYMASRVPPSRQDKKDIVSGGTSRAVNLPAVPAAKRAPQAAAPAEAKTFLREGGDIVIQGNTFRWTGAASGIHEPLQKVIRNAEEWKALWSRHVSNQIPPPPAPAIDFSRQMVAAIFSGNHPSGGYKVEISGVREDKGQLIIEYIETNPPADTLSISMITQPYDIRILNRSDLPAHFRLVP